MKSEIITDETLEFILIRCEHLNVSLEIIEEAYEAADTNGYVDNDGYSNNPDSLLSYIEGYITAKLNSHL